MQVPPPLKAAKKHKSRGQGLKPARTRVKAKSLPLAAAAYVPYVSAFTIGDHISHPQFGAGIVTQIDDAKLTIDFATRGTKQIIDYFVQRAV